MRRRKSSKPSSRRSSIWLFGEPLSACCWKFRRQSGIWRLYTRHYMTLDQFHSTAELWIRWKNSCDGPPARPSSYHSSYLSPQLFMIVLVESKRVKAPVLFRADGTRPSFKLTEAVVISLVLLEGAWGSSPVLCRSLSKPAVISPAVHAP